MDINFSDPRIKPAGPMKYQSAKLPDDQIKSRHLSAAGGDFVATEEGLIQASWPIPYHFKVQAWYFEYQTWT